MIASSAAQKKNQPKSSSSGGLATTHKEHHFPTNNKPRRAVLWEEDEEEENEAAADGHDRSNHPRESQNNSNNNNNDHHRLKVNRRVAQEYQARKEREELLQHRRRQTTKTDTNNAGSGSDDSTADSSEDEEDEDAQLLTAHLDVQVLKTINAIRNRDSTIYDPNQRFFDDDNDGSGSGREDEDESSGPVAGDRNNRGKQPALKKAKVKRYKDVVREQLLRQVKRRDERGDNADDDDDDEEEGLDDSDNEERQRHPAPPASSSSGSRLAYDAQQHGLRAAFLQAATKALDPTSTSDDNPDGGDPSDPQSRTGDDNWMTVKARLSNAADNEDEGSASAALRQFDEEMRRLESSVRQQSHHNHTTTGPVPSELVDPKGEVADGEAFLLQYFKDRKWMDPSREGDSSSDNSSEGESDDDGDHEENSDNDGANPMDADNDDNDDDDEGEIGADDDASLQDLDQADDFEARYNFRFEQEGGGASSGVATATGALGSTLSGADASLVRYSRGHDLPTYRRPDTTRQERRQARKERKAAERQAQEEQLRRLKNAKRRELEGQLRQIKAVLGEIGNSGDDDQDNAKEASGTSSSSAIDEAAILKLLEGDFDPDKFEQLMQEAYGDQFYDKPDAAWKSDQDVRNTLLHADEEDGALLVGHDDEDGGLYDNAEEEEDGDYDENDHGNGGYGEEYEDEEEEEWPEELEEEFDDNDGATTTDLERKVKSKLLDELYKLDYEDIVAGQPTRFKYRKVPANNFGLSAEEILLARDSTLKKFVSLKQIAPYRDDEYFVGSRKRRRFREWLQHDLEEENKAEEKESTHGKTATQESTLGEGDAAPDDTAMDADPANNPEGDAVESKKKKKNRRLKKNKKRLDPDHPPEGASAAVEEPKRLDPATSAKSSSTSTTAKEPHVSASPIKAESRSSGEGRSTIALPSTKASATTADHLLAESQQKSEEQSHKQKKNKKTKKKKKTKKGSTKHPSVEGVSEARLTSYGL